MTEKYIQYLDDEIGADVYFYYNKVRDNIDCFTVGCEISQWDGEKIINLLDLDEFNKNQHYIFFNVCAVTESAKIVCEKITEKLVSVYPNSKFFFLGCGVNYNQDYYKKYGVALKNQDKFNVKNYGCKKKKEDWSFKINKHRDVGFVKIEDGCYNNCAYCIIHKIRPHYMISYDKIKKQIRALLNQGKKNIQLIGTEITIYNSDGLRLTDLCKKILSDFPEIDSLVIGALDPASKEVDKLIELMKSEPRIFNSLYLCTQSCSNTILKNMRRRHNSNRLRELKNLGGDKIDFVYQLIVGFPGETDELFKETLDFVKELKPIDIDTIPFSPRIGTDAYDMPNQIDSKTISEREKELYEAVKSYSSFEDENKLRSIKPMNKRNIEEFMRFYLDTGDAKIVHLNLYLPNSFKMAFNILSKYNKKELNDLFIETSFNKNFDLYDYDVNIKLLIALLGIKVITNITLDDDTIPFMAKGYYTPENISYRFCTYLNFNFKKLNRASKEDLLSIFKTVAIYNLYDTDIMAAKLLKAGNSDYFKYIKENLNINI